MYIIFTSYDNNLTTAFINALIFILVFYFCILYIVGNKKMSDESSYGALNIVGEIRQEAVA